ncbi:MAG: hypothetical protein DI551_08825 [Micavibrio aeruginosavorus]|uniref:Transglycosylase SLT domain-containing protein n=1 Tax=Micavibrio aeruginosavorus TaxID=349221 RepID=A0A2W5PK92_9BACT|nr:MAG: hypothetical protein DI551_08825 [Micavibrio aeruginosavorus]
MSKNTLIKKVFFGVAALGAAAAAPALAEDNNSGNMADPAPAALLSDISYNIPPPVTYTVTPPPASFTPPSASKPLMVQPIPSAPSNQNDCPSASDGASYERISGKCYYVSAAVHAAFDAAKLPKEALLASAAHESSVIPTRINPTSKACGLFQLMTDRRTATLYEAVYNFGEKYGYEKEAAMVQRINMGTFKDGTIKFGYYPKTPAFKKHLDTLCLDPVFSTKMHEGYTLPKVIAFKEQFGRDMTYGDLVGMNNWGNKGWRMIVEQVQADEKAGTATPARKFFADRAGAFGGSVKGNAYAMGGSIRDAYNKLVARGGEQIIKLASEPLVKLQEMVPAITMPDFTISISTVIPALPKLKFRH